MVHPAERSVRELEDQRHQHQGNQDGGGERQGQALPVVVHLRAGRLAGRAAGFDNRRRTLRTDQVFATHCGLLWPVAVVSVIDWPVAVGNN
jgi:hypothetical protein